MFTEDDLSELFDRAVRDLDPAVHPIVAEAERRGRRLRTQRRAGQALGGGFVAVLTATAVLAGMSLIHPGSALVAAGSRGHHSGKNTGASRASESPSPTISPEVSPAPGIHVTPSISTPGKSAPGDLMPAAQMLATLKNLLPAGSTLGYVNPYATESGNVEVDYNDGNGAVDLQLSVEPSSMFSPLSCPTPLWTDEGTRPAGALPISCAMRTLPDGSIERDAVYYADAYGFYGYSVYDQRPNGITVDLEVGNGILHGLPQVDRAQPPGSMAQWEALAENPGWQ
jgi:hypothetical protein